MNPKKQIMKYLNSPSCDHPPDETCAVCEKVQRIQDGMSAGTCHPFYNPMRSATSMPRDIPSKIW